MNHARFPRIIGYFSLVVILLIARKKKKPVCGNGKIERREKCDDGNTQSGDGCSDKCKVESGGPGNGSICGNGVREGKEDCDDGPEYNGSPNYNCTAQCTFPADCGDGVCDKEWEAWNTCLDDCKDTTCIPRDARGRFVFEEGGRGGRAKKLGECCDGLVDVGMGDMTFICTSAGNGICDPWETYMTGGGDCKCGNQMDDRGEGCDLGYHANGRGEGCTADCQVELGWACTGGGPSQRCYHTCGNGKIDDIPYTTIHESCDDGNLIGGDGCSPYCRREAGYSCIGEPSTCWRY
jgi:cysteine-rich repeat protein